MTDSTSPAPDAPRKAASAQASGPSTRDQLVVYLRNHDAALVAVAERLGLTARSHLQASVREVLSGLQAQLRSDREALGRVMHALGVPPSRVQRAATLLGERFGRLKPNGSWSRRTPLTDVVELEALGVAAVGTLRLWQTLLLWQQLEGVGPLGSRLDAVDLSGLVSAARRRVETLERLHDESVRSLVDGRDENGRNERIDPLEHVDHDGHDGG